MGEGVPPVAGWREIGSLSVLHEQSGWLGLCGVAAAVGGQGASASTKYNAHPNCFAWLVLSLHFRLGFLIKDFCDTSCNAWLRSA
eukprot:5377583-Pyramimonas_sp.AAC.1